MSGRRVRTYMHAYLRADVLERQAEVILVDDVGRDGLGDNLVEDRLPAPVSPGRGDGLGLFLLPSRSGRHVAEDVGYTRPRTDAGAAAVDGGGECATEYRQGTVCHLFV